jgi:hypothetical protein
MLNGFVLLIGLADGADVSNPVPRYDTLIQVFLADPADHNRALERAVHRCGALAL